MAGLANIPHRERAIATPVAKFESPAAIAAPVWKSIRFRLTGWYALLVFCLILGMSIALHGLLVRTLANDAEGRLRVAAEEITVDSNARVVGPAGGTGSPLQINLQPPDEASLLLSGVWFQFYNSDRQPIVITPGRNLTEIPESLSRALEEPEEFWTDRTVLESISVGGVESMVLFSPLRVLIGGELVDQDEPPGWIVVGEPLGSRAKLVAITDQSLFLFGMAGALLAVWIGWVMAGRALTPVTRVMESASAIALADGPVSLSRRLLVPTTGDELSQLALTFNVMLDRIERAFASQQRFVADASHELRTPLTAVRGTVDVMMREMDAGREMVTTDVSDDLQVVKRESSRMSRLIDDMLMLARTDGTTLADVLNMDDVRLDELGENAFRVANQLADGRELRLAANDPVVVAGDADRLVQVMIILLDNAIRHTPRGGSVTLTIDTAVDEASGVACARIIVCDAGEGIPAEHVPYLFERFYRVEVARSRESGGTGLGLSIALALVRGHDGWIDVDTRVGEGTTFTVWLPALASSEPGAKAKDDRSPAWAATLVPRPIRIRRPGMSRRPLTPEAEALDERDTPPG